ncbi:AzlD domain-containing protein [Neotabrizicola sp. VNH66]|uniref:AzlD domain-containing protein n=1 Tax=Neotabrizicola sp. VNH66 TaxID=3400918 RepID=UPI003BFFF079
MSLALLAMAVLAGAANWMFRVLPTVLLRRDPQPGGLLSRFLASTGPAAIATLCVASVLPQLYPVPRDGLPLAAGVAATVAAFLPRRSVVLATLAGSAAYGLAYALSA